MKSYTDIEQSMKLAKILSIESADMRWYYKYNEGDKPQLDICNGSRYYIPCWSLAALLDVLPKETRLLKSATNNTYHCDCPKGNIGKWYDNPVDACVDMIFTLK